MENSRKLALGIFILSVLAIFVLILFLFNRVSFTGHVVESLGDANNNQVQAIQVSCSDSDGMNYDYKGSVRYCENSKCSNEEDSCSGKDLTEFYCKDNVKKSTTYQCNDDCYEGACVNLVVKYKQSNSGGGSSSGGGGSSSDSGSSTSAIPESYATYDLGEISSEQIQELSKNENIKFKINGKGYNLNLQDNTATQISISISGVSSFNIGIGEDREIDLNGDGVSDLYILLKSVNTVTGKVKLVLYQAFYYG